MANRAKLSLPSGVDLFERPEEFNDCRSWRQITIKWLISGQPRPYADSVYSFNLTFTGGTRSTHPGFDLPFGSRPDEQFVKSCAKLIGRYWSDADDRHALSPWLKTFDLIEDEPSHVTYHFVVIEPYCD